MWQNSQFCPLQNNWSTAWKILILQVELKGVLYFAAKISMFVLYFKLINTFLKTNLSILQFKAVQRSKQLLMKTIFWLFWSITLKELGHLRFQYYFLSDACITFQKCFDNFITTNIFWLTLYLQSLL